MLCFEKMSVWGLPVVSMVVPLLANKLQLVNPKVV